MALDLWNSVTLEVGQRGVAVRGEGEGVLSLGADNLVHRAAEALFREAGVSPPDFFLTCHNAIPLERGLGSSAAAAVGGLLAANALCEDPLPPQELLRLAVGLEGHPDNAAAALFGGCQIVAQDGDDLLCASAALPSGLRAVLFIPDEAMNTAQARAVLPPIVSRQDAAFNAARTALLVNALAAGRLEHLRTATQDRLHQPQREVLFPAMRLIFSAALNAGAHGVFLSGAGSTVLALASAREMTIGYEMADVAEKAGVRGDIRVVDLGPRGAHVVRVE